MENRGGATINRESIEEFKSWLRAEERSEGTIVKYMRDLTRFSDWMYDRHINREMLIEYKEHLTQHGFEAVTVNSMLAAINTYFRYIGLNIRLKYLRIQRRLFREENRELQKNEYEKLIRTAETRGDFRLALLMETIGATGIRVSEVQYITVEAAKSGRTQISLKGKICDILLPNRLCKKLLKYARKQNIAAGEIFITKSGKGISRKQIWAEMKAICKIAGVEASKVFPHNLRHLFARVFYRVTRDVTQLADLLGHSSIETTRIYLRSTGAEHVRQLEGLKMVR